MREGDEMPTASKAPDEVIYSLRDQASFCGEKYNVEVDADILFEMCVELELRRHDAAQAVERERTKPDVNGMEIGWRVVNEEPSGMLVPGRHLAERIGREITAAETRGAERMREACVTWHDEQMDAAADEAAFNPEYHQKAGFHCDSKKAIAALPLPPAPEPQDAPANG